MLPPSTQIGGKGTVRRKRKRVGNNFLEKKTKNHREYELKIKQINNMIKDISDDDEYTKFKLYLDTEFEDIGIAIEKHDLLKKAKKDFSEIKEDCLTYVYNLLVKSIDKPLEFNELAYSKLKATFDLEMLSIFIKFIYEIETGLEKKTYLEKEEKEDDVDIEDIKEYMELLELDKNEIPSVEDIEKAYKKKALIYHPDRNVNKEDTTEQFNKLKLANDVLIKRYKK